MEPTIKMIQTVQGDDVKWRNLGEQELKEIILVSEWIQLL